MSCLFYSLGHFTRIDANQMREMICNYLLKNENISEDLSVEDVVKFESNLSLEQYVSNMRKPCTMGGATEIKAFCNMFKRNVIVHSRPNNKLIEFTADADFPTVELSWTGGHFDPIP